MVSPGRQVGEFLLSDCLYGPAPGLKESSQVHPHSLGESLSIQIHLSIIVTRKVAHLVVGSEHLLKGIPTKLIPELHGERGKGNCEKEY